MDADEALNDQVDRSLRFLTTTAIDDFPYVEMALVGALQQSSRSRLRKFRRKLCRHAPATAGEVESNGRIGSILLYLALPDARSGTPDDIGVRLR